VVTEKSTSLKNHLASKYKFKDLGPAGLYTGIYIIRDRNQHRLFLDQAPYVSEILEDYKMTLIGYADGEMTLIGYADDIKDIQAQIVALIGDADG